MKSCEAIPHTDQVPGNNPTSSGSRHRRIATSQCLVHSRRRTSPLCPSGGGHLHQTVVVRHLRPLLARCEGQLKHFRAPGEDQHADAIRSGKNKACPTSRAGFCSFSESSRADSRRQKQPVRRQHFLKSLPELHGQRSFLPSFSDSSLLPWTIRTPRFTFVSDGNPSATLAHRLEKNGMWSRLSMVHRLSGRMGRETPRRSRRFTAMTRP